MITIIIHNSTCFIKYGDNNPNVINELSSNLNDLLSYRKEDYVFIRNVMKKKYRDAKIFSKEELRKSRPDLLKYLYITPQRLEEWVEKATIVKLFNRSNNSFPTGLLCMVEKYLKNFKIHYTIEDARKKPEEKEKNYLKLTKLPKLRYYQKEILEKLKIHSRGIVEAATGTGKTLIIKELIKEKGVKTLVVVPSSNILDIFESQLIELYGKRFVGVITGGKKQFDKDITVATYQSLPKIPAEWFESIDMLITDEFHHSSAETLSSLNFNQFKDIYFRYGFTATNYRNDNSDLSLKAIMSDVLYEYGFNKGISDKFLSPIKFIVYKYDNPYIESKWREENQMALIQNEEYNDKIVEIAQKLDSNNVPTIIFVNEIKHGEILQEKIEGSVFITGKWKRKVNKQILEDFNDNKFNILIGTSVIGEGVDTVPAQVGILASGFKADSEVVQKIGRLLRPHENKKSAYFIDFTNKGTKYLYKHHNARMEIYKRYPSEIIYRDF